MLTVMSQQQISLIDTVMKMYNFVQNELLPHKFSPVVTFQFHKF